MTLQAYRSRFLSSEPRDPRYEPLAQRLSQMERVDVPTLMIHGGDDRCDEPASSEHQESFFTAGYQRLVFDGIGHFPHREAPDELALAIDPHLRANA